MSISWDYVVILGEQGPSSHEIVTPVIEAAKTADYSPWNRRLGKIGGISHDGMDELEFDDLETLQEYLCLHGGLIFFHRYIHDNWLTIDIAFEAIKREISLSIKRNLYDDEEDDILTAADLERIFADICQRLEALYGYSAHDITLEDQPPYEGFTEAWKTGYGEGIRSFRVPKTLYWLNYFSAEYFARIGDWRLSQIPHEKRPLLDQGVFIYLAQHPWQGKIATLQPDGTYKLAW